MRRHRGSHSPYPKGNNTPIPENVTLIRTFNSATNPSRPVRPSPLTRSAIQDMPLDMLDRIRSFPLFQSAPDAFLAAIGAHLRPQTHGPHDYILTEGDEAKAMYWLIRGAVAVTSRDGESTYAELRPGAFFGEIGVLMGIPRTATIVARTKCLLVVLKKEDLAKIMPNYPDVERAIREEAQERLAILESKKKESPNLSRSDSTASRGEKRAFVDDEGDLSMGDVGRVRGYNAANNNKKRKSPSPGLVEAAASSALGSGSIHVRQLLKELPLFANLPSEILHFLGFNAQQRTFAPFTDIIKQGSRGTEVYFIVKGEVEVIDEKSAPQDRKTLTNAAGKTIKQTSQVKARLKQGNYFGEVVSLSLAPRRTATVRSVSLVECLLITGEVLTEFWDRCPSNIRQQVERTAKQRLGLNNQNDVVMVDADSTPPIDELAIGERKSKSRKAQLPKVVFDHTPGFGSKLRHAKEQQVSEPVDPDPYLIPDLDNVRARSRRSSLAPVSPEAPHDGSERASSASSLHTATPPDPTVEPKRPRAMSRALSRFAKGAIPDSILLLVFNHIELHHLMRLQLVSSKWAKLLKESPEILHHLDLSLYNRKVTDRAVKESIGPFVGHRPRVIDLSNCFHITDNGFVSLASMCGGKVMSWRMKSVWDVSAVAIHEMVKQAKDLEDVDLSNCRKVNDALLMHVIGNVPLPPPQLTHHPSPHGPYANHHSFAHAFRPYPGRPPGAHTQHPPNPPPQPPNPTPQAVIIGSQKLKKLTLSYCKHVTDRSMAHIGTYARLRLEEIDLTRCTTITDHGFEAWGQHQFSRLTKLCLADCTYLTDHAIVALTNAAPGLRYLDLVRLFQ
ncbi:MAG: hypothetical protein LQ340_004502 [Diploschistes diacapsis]|nr:MAG: hypothetical protein LQ340_004502 [Diploschistes diacapsis]